MRVFMLGWEFPPFISGGLGTACYGLTKAMSGLGTDVMFVLPRPVSTPFSTHVRLVSPRADSPLASPSTEFRLDEFVHVHSTEFDRSGQNVNQQIYDIERRGMHGALKVIAVSHLTRNICAHHYGVDPGKVEVVYNAIDLNGNGFDEEKYKIHKDEKIVLFLGRITMQKGPEYFLAAAKKVLEVMDNVKFVMAGSGDMIRRIVEMAAAMGIGHKA